MNVMQSPTDTGSASWPFATPTRVVNHAFADQRRESRRDCVPIDIGNLNQFVGCSATRSQAQSLNNQTFQMIGAGTADMVSGLKGSVGIAPSRPCITRII